VLRIHRERMQVEAAAHGAELGPDLLVFVDEAERPLDGNDFREDEFYRLIDEVGLRRATFHSLRYVGETLDVMANVPEKVAMQQRGRKSQEMRRHYTRPADEEQIKAAKRSGDLLFSADAQVHS